MKKKLNTIIAKKNRRRKVHLIKKSIKNSLGEHWLIIEMKRRMLKTVKHPKYRITKKNVSKAKGKVKLIAPKHIDYYNFYNYELTNKLIDDMKSCVQDFNRRVSIDFSNTKGISAAAMISLLAEVDLLVKQSSHGIRAVSFSHPKSEKVRSILKQVGFYGLLNKECGETEDYEDVVFWKYASGACSEAILAQPIMQEIKKEVEVQSSRRLYRGFVEAMSNSVEHAYVDDNLHCEEEGTARWWAFAGIDEKRLVVVICDKGVGIPNTLPKTQGISKLSRLFEKLKLDMTRVKDSAYIKAAASLSHTRTGKEHRGKGLTDMKSVIDVIGSGNLSIFSNKGFYLYKNGDAAIRDHKRSVCGTIVEWSIPFTSKQD